ncbi:hypothetical protein BLNAU_6702 [Blattamonas nauphoetae]|uniref:Uncharacterized protein n=1 Tax=Blattamonas nauphoetae TaxID=2049346 RepID=A0ABQ9Y3U7_9EUKA|nr:hypothetical protein BLNAU_6702 [Blattamonas nauphoetae]
MQNCVLLIDTPLSPTFVSRGGTLNLDTPFLLIGNVLSFQPHLVHFSNIPASLLANNTDDVWSDNFTDSVVIASSNFDRCDACCTGTLFSGSRVRTLFTLDCSFSHLTLTNEGQQTLSDTKQLIGDVFASILEMGKEERSNSSPPMPLPSSPSFNGGAVFASNGKVVVTGATFTECTRHCGGAITTTGAQFTVKVSTIKSGRSGGKNVMIACQRFPVNDYDGYNYFVSGFNDSVAEGGTQNVQLGTSGYVFGATVGSMEANIHVATSGSNVWDCGDQSKQCKTVTYAGNKVTANYKVIVAAGEYSPENGEETCILVNAKTVRIKGAGSSSTSVSFIKPTFFQTANMKVTAGILAVSAMSLTLNADSTDTWHLIEIDGSGSAALTNCILKGTGSEQNGRLVTIRGGSLTAVGCSMSGTTDIAGSSIQLEHESKQATLQITAVSSLMNTDTTTTVKTIDFAFQTPLSSSTPLLFTLNWFLHASIVLLQVAWLCRDRSDSDLVLVARNRHRLSLNLCRRRHFQFLFLHWHSPHLFRLHLLFLRVHSSQCWDSLVHILLHHFLSLVIF